MPEDLEAFRAESPERAAEWRDGVASAVEEQLAAGRVAAVFDRAGSAYGFVDAGEAAS